MYHENGRTVQSLKHIMDLRSRDCSLKVVSVVLYAGALPFYLEGRNGTDDFPFAFKEDL